MAAQVARRSDAAKSKPLGDATLLGAVSLESLGFVLDAIRRDLLPLPMVIAESLRS
jgi:hypothetical protein